MNEELQAKNIRRITDQLFFATVLIQSLVAILIFVGVSVKTRRDEESKVSRIVTSAFAENRKSLTEAVYIDQVLGVGHVSGSRALEGLKSTLSQAGLVDARVAIASCKQPARFKFEIEMGHSKLDDCVFVAVDEASLVEQLAVPIGLLLVSIIALTLVWMITRERFKRQVIAPVLESLTVATRYAAMSELASQVAHDIRSPLSVITLVVKHPGEINDEARALLLSATKRIEATATTLLTQRRGLLTVTPAIQPTRVVDVLDAVLAEKRRMNAGVKFEVINRLPEATVGSAATDLANIFSNLFDNSVQAMGGQGAVEVRIESHAKTVRISIRDSGGGFPEGVLKAGGDRPLSVGKESGNGLGLYGAAKVLADAKGTLKLANSDLGGGLVVLAWPMAFSGVKRSRLQRLLTNFTQAN